MNDGRRVSLTGASRLGVRSSILGCEVEISIGLPLGYETSEQVYPLVILLDGYWYFPIVSHAVRPLQSAGQLPPLIIAGVSYPATHLNREAESERFGQYRFRDFTPSCDRGEWWRTIGDGAPLHSDIETGRASDFLNAIECEVLPAIARDYRIDIDRLGLAGFSLAGLFVLFAMLRCDSAFSRFLAASPSLWWHGDAIFSTERDLAAVRDDLAARLFLSVGELEEAEPHSSFRMVSNVQRLAAILEDRDYPSFILEHAVLAGETHASAISNSFIRGLVSLYGENVGKIRDQKAT